MSVIEQTVQYEKLKAVYLQSMKEFIELGEEISPEKALQLMTAFQEQSSASLNVKELTREFDQWDLSNFRDQDISGILRRQSLLPVKRQREKLQAATYGVWFTLREILFRDESKIEEAGGIAEEKRAELYRIVSTALDLNEQ